MHARPVALLLALGCTWFAGCKCCRRDPPPPACPPGAVRSGAYIPPQGIPEGPPPLPRGAAPEAGPAPAGGTELLLPQSAPGRSSSQKPRVVPADPPEGAILGDPSTADKPNAGKPAELDPLPPDPKPTPAAADRAVGVDELVRVKEGVFAGRRPTLEGLDSLKAKGYKTVIHIRRPQDNDDTDRRQVEKRDLKFIRLTVSPELLTRPWIDQFNEIVGDTATRPVFVYAQDPPTAGVVWYLHLRTAEFLTHDEARVRARPLGLADETSALFQSALRVAPPNS
jgi:protein tyrosine phosphatase (PTP) superfamily phosphohydrolase (DUF442 family)